MILQPIARASIADEVFAQLSEQIVSDAIAAGETLPSERKLAEAFGVSRPVVREALRRLEQAGLVQVRHGDATVVRDFRRAAGPELLPLLVAPGGRLDAAVIGSVLEARQAIGTEIAGLAGRKGGTEQLRADLAAAAAAVAGGADPVARQRLALEFWEIVVDLADSLAYRLIFNSLRRVYEPAIEALAAVMDAETGRADLYGQLREAILAGDESGARARAAELLTLGSNAFAAALAELS
ncbi:GntR family transcriptional regulator [Nocardia sp. NPDC005825]|uniref:FadR/GntR family transcriptional regulator n=1 Tax=unclassified Nocardia TaxID=2637762 RepID=UPI0033EAA78D